MSADFLGLQPIPQRDESFVHWLRGPDPLLDGIELVAAGLAAAHVPHHVPGVLRIGEDVAHVRGSPVADGALRVDRNRRRIGGGVAVEPVRDRLVAEAFSDPPVVRLPHRGRLCGVDFEERLLGALGPLGRDRVRDVPGAVAVAGLADVVAGLGVDGVAVPRLLQHVDDIELGQGLLHPPREQLSGPLGFASVHQPELERFVGGQQAHSGLFQAVLDGGAVVHVPGSALDRLADDVVEAPIRPLSFGEKVLDSAVTRDGDLELFVGAAAPAGVEVHAPGLDVVKVRDDQAVLGQGALRVPQLTRQRQRWVLHVLRGHASEPCEAKVRRPRSDTGRSAARRFAVGASRASYAALSGPRTDLFRACHCVTSQSTRACSATSR
ncbi:hypothetical protein VA596_01715 [Amycolatopsis sp., V23-08]|uniref:Uncharacterized protein n=1 Tax=Amycolatopsis heterodermiae TaxID=3110235 RepID=A0ABU5QWE5_9PSEU|nr:hypothetical protein [Amycolatopsis sp., V23-08]MEA5358238.1 hypothetical protein [Amycolatopsis sp., V23-08]